MRSWSGAVCAVLLLGALPAAPASGQAIERPADERPPLEPFEPETPAEPPTLLPAIPEPPPGRDRLSSGLTVFVREVRVTGSSVFSSDELDEITAPWTHRKIDSAEIQDLVDAITRLYVENDYVSSGAIVPDQDLEDGVLVIEVIEAKLADVVVEGNRWYRSRYLRNRLLASVPAPVNMRTLQDQLQLLLQEPGIRRVGGELQPGVRRGENVLALAVEEESPIGLRGSVANDEPPGVGSVRGRLMLEHRTLLGYGDILQSWFDFTEGLNSQNLRYELPLLGRGTALRLGYRRTESEIVESPFDEADIKSSTWTAGIGIRHPFIRTPTMQLWVGVYGERRQSTTKLFGDRFSFVPGPENGRADVSVLRFVQDWIWRSRDDVLAARSTVSWGVDLLDATKHSTHSVPDGRYAAWLAQAQWAHRFPEWLLGSQILTRFDLQLSNDPLLSLEQIAVGGVRTVRGYRENLLVRDNAAIGSVELRIPILPDLTGPHQVEFAPFFDIGRAWNEGRPTQGQKQIESLGVGLLYAFRDRLQAYAYWGGRLSSVDRSSSNIQDNGYHLGVTLRVF